MTSKEIIASLPLVSENILNEAAKQPELFIQATRYRISKMRKRSQAVAAIEGYRASLSLKIRAKKNVAGEKLTEGALKERVEVDKTHRSLRAQMERAYEAEEFSKLLLESLRMRRDAIRIIAEARMGEVPGNEIEKAVRRRLSDDARRLSARRKPVENDEEEED